MTEISPKSLDASPIRLFTDGPVDGPAVVVLHGWGSSARIMAGFSDALREEFRVVNVDLPGHGTAPQPSMPMGMEGHAALVSEVIDSVGGPAHLIGHSNGGRIALYMATQDRYRDKIRSLTMVSPSGVKPRRTLGFHLRRGLATTLKSLFIWLPSPLRDAGLDWLRHSLVWRLLGSSDYQALSGSMRETFVRLVNTYVQDRVDRIRVPVLLFWGNRDTAISRFQMDTLVSCIPNVGFCELKEAGHFGFLDQPATVYAGTRHFLKGQESDRLSAASKAKGEAL